MTDADRLSRLRRIMLAAYGVMFLGLQAVVFDKLDDPLDAWRPIHFALGVGFLGWLFTLTYILGATNAFFRGSPETVRAMNDELTAANRSTSYRTGYWAVLLAGLGLWGLSQVESISVQEALRLLLAVGVAVPAIRFAMLERQQGG